MFFLKKLFGKKQPPAAAPATTAAVNHNGDMVQGSLLDKFPSYTPVAPGDLFKGMALVVADIDSDGHRYYQRALFSGWDGTNAIVQLYDDSFQTMNGVDGLCHI